MAQSEGFPAPVPAVFHIGVLPASRRLTAGLALIHHESPEQALMH
jgi:hypothetical protein